MTTSTDKVEKLKKSMPKGWSQIIAMRLKVSRATVSRAINRYDVDSDIMYEAIKLAEETQRKRQSIEGKIDSLIITDKNDNQS